MIGFLLAEEEEDDDELACVDDVAAAAISEVAVTGRARAVLIAGMMIS